MLYPRPLHQNVLIIGASGRTGTELIQCFASHESKPYVHALDRDASKLEAMEDMCTSIIEGDARDPSVIASALSKTRARVAIVCVANGKDKRASDVRTASARALVSVIQQPDFKHIRVVVLSRAVGAGVGTGKIIEFRNKNALQDHNSQEDIFLSFYSESLLPRTDVIRPTCTTSRAALASFVVTQLCDGLEPVGGKIVVFHGPGAKKVANFCGKARKSLFSKVKNLATNARSHPKSKSEVSSIQTTSTKSIRRSSMQSGLSYEWFDDEEEITFEDAVMDQPVCSSLAEF